jgi:hypothetical protein
MKKGKTYGTETLLKHLIIKSGTFCFGFNVRIYQIPRFDRLNTESVGIKR